jgi:hypothetical protein
LALGLLIGPLNQECTVAKSFQILILASAVFVQTAHADMNSIVHGTSCSSQGSWTQNALEQANAIVETVTNLANDPNCAAFTKVIGTIGASTFNQTVDPKSEQAKQSFRAETIMSELNALRTVLGNNADAAKIISPILAKTTLQSMTSVVGSSTTSGAAQRAALALLTGRFSVVADRGLNMLNQLFTALPQHTKCMDKRPDAIASLFVGGVRMAAAFGTGGQGISERFASTLGNFISFLRAQKFAKIEKQLNKQKFWTEISCLIESTQANYCAVRDGFELLKSQKAAAAKSFKGTPLEGYYIMSREVPQLSSWIQQIQNGIEPRLITDAAAKKNVWTSMNKLYEDYYDIPALYFENFNTVYKVATTLEQKQNNIRNIVLKLSELMTNGGYGEKAGVINFFAQAKDPDFMPFFLIGRDRIPEEIISRGQDKMTVGDYLRNLEKTPELRNPDALMDTVLVQLRELMDQAMISGADYFRKRMSVDQTNLVDESMTGSTVTVRESARNIRNYLKNLYGRLQNEPLSQAILPSIIETMSKLDRLDKKFKALDVASERFKRTVNEGAPGFNIDDLSGYDGDKRNQMKLLFEGIVLSVYEEFNIMLQRDAFFTTRISTYVKHDYFSRAKHEDFSKYANQLMVTAGNNILDRLQEYQRFNIAEAEADLSNANNINMENLDQLEDLVVGHVEDYLLNLNKRAGRNFAKTNNPDLLHTFILPQKMVLFAKKQDLNNESENVRAKVCIQTLGFKRFKRFVFLCQGAKLQSTLGSNKKGFSLPVEFDYNKLMHERLKGDSLVNKLTNSAMTEASNRFSNVCLLRDYFRNNLVGWMSQNFNE